MSERPDPCGSFSFLSRSFAEAFCESFSFLSRRVAEALCKSFPFLSRRVAKLLARALYRHQHEVVWSCMTHLHGAARLPCRCNDETNPCLKRVSGNLEEDAALSKAAEIQLRTVAWYLI